MALSSNQKTEAGLFKDYDRRLALEALQTLKQLQIAPQPKNYALWFRYHQQADRRLVDEIDRLVKNGTPLSQAVLSELYSRHIAQTINAKNLDRTVQRMEAAARGFVGHMADAGRSSKRHATNLDALHIDLADGSGAVSPGNPVQGLFDQLQQMSRENTLLSKRIAATSHEVAEIKESLRRSREEAWTDGLTGVPNRSAFDCQMDEAITNGQGGKPFCFIMADVDHFKAVNDTLGHVMGDKVLGIVAKILRHQLKEEDFVARYGGEEFAVLVFDKDLAGAVAVAERLRVTLANRRLCNRRTGTYFDPVTMSFGVTAYRKGDEAANVIRRADAALYDAKRAGRNCVRSCQKLK